jgi:hypothetical protein
MTVTTERITELDEVITETPSCPQTTPLHSAAEGELPGIEHYVTEVMAAAAAGTLKPHEYLILHAPGNAQQQMMLTAAALLNRSDITADELQERNDRDGVTDFSRLLPGVMRYLQRERPEYVAEVAEIISDLEARWEEVKDYFISMPIGS